MQIDMHNTSFFSFYHAGLEEVFARQEIRLHNLQ